MVCCVDPQSTSELQYGFRGPRHLRSSRHYSSQVTSRMNLHRRAHTINSRSRQGPTAHAHTQAAIATWRRHLKTHSALHTATQTWVCAAGAQLSHPLAGLAPVEMAALTNHERLSLPRCASSIPSSSRHAERRGRAGRKRVEPTKDTPHWHPVTDAPHGEVEPARHLRVKEGLVESRAVTSLRRRRDPVHLAGRRERHMPLSAKPRSAQLRLRPRGEVAP